MVLRKTKKKRFYGCSTFPKCYGTRDLEGKSKKDLDREAGVFVEDPPLCDCIDCWIAGEPTH